MANPDPMDNGVINAEHALANAIRTLADTYGNWAWVTAVLRGGTFTFSVGVQDGFPDLLPDPNGVDTSPVSTALSAYVTAANASTGASDAGARAGMAQDHSLWVHTTAV